MEINTPPMPQTVLELIEEGLEQVYKAMKTEFNQYSSFITATGHPSSQLRAVIQQCHPDRTKDNILFDLDNVTS